MSKKRVLVVKAEGEVEGEGEAAPAEVGEVGRLLESSQADDRKMIRLVRERPLLYARNNMPVASYYSRVKRLWQEVAALMGWSVAEVRRKWSHVRNSYSRHLRNELHGARTGRGRAVSRWYLADELQFLRDHMATDTRSSPYKQYLPSMVPSSVPDMQPESVDIKPFISSPWFSLAAGSACPKLEPPDPYLEDSSNSQAFDSDETSSYFQFFRGIYGDYQELPPEKQRRFRRRCINYLHELLDESDSPDPELGCEHEPHSRAQSGAINLSSSVHDGEHMDAQMFVIADIAGSPSN